MKKIVFAALLGALAATAAQAADPTATTASFAEYSGSTEVGVGLIDTNTLFYIDEKSVGGEKSWYVFYEPGTPKSLSTTITFSSPITSVIVDEQGLASSNATYGLSSITYGSSQFIGLETGPGVKFPDTYSINGNQLTINWYTANPGDHIRVLTQAAVVPEPSTNALFVGGLFAFGFIAWRRKNV